jgi:DNA-binding transcriptional MerR regulator/methylmalonyl-CoA mutase cobalamin-binding subunit
MTDTVERVPRYPIRAVSKLTGIGIDTLRAWERRYGAVTPTRDDRGRLYSEADIARLRLLHRAVASGHGVGRVASLTDAELQRLVTPEQRVDLHPPAPPRGSLDTSTFRGALMSLDSAALDHELSRLAAVLTPAHLVQDVLLPTIREAGDSWHRTQGGIAHEHVLSATMRHLLGSFLRLHARRDPAVRLVFTTLSGDRHEIGILGAAMLAASRGLGVSYLGPDLPAVEIAAAVKAAEAHVLVLGITLNEAHDVQARELRAIADNLSSTVEIWAGGAGAVAHADAFGPRALVLADFDAYLAQVDRLAARLR